LRKPLYHWVLGLHRDKSKYISKKKQNQQKKYEEELERITQSDNEGFIPVVSKAQKRNLKRKVKGEGKKYYT